MDARLFLQVPRTRRPATERHVWWIAFGVIALCVTSATTARADVPPRAFDRDGAVPAEVERSAPLPLRVGRDQRAEHQRLVIPAKLLAALVKAKPGDKTTSATQFRSIVAAVALSAAVAAGLVIGRSRQRTGGQRWLLSLYGLVSLTAVAIAANTVFADLLPPGGGPRRPRPAPVREGDAEERPAAGTIVIEVTQEGDEILLLLGRDGLPPR